MRSARAAWLPSFWTGSVLVLSAVGCSNAKFSGQAPVKLPVPLEPKTESYATTCAGGALQQDVTVPPATPTKAKLKGELCPTAAGAATVLFVVDYSGSMGKHVPKQGQAAVAGNDPEADQSCGRLEAAKAVVAQLAASTSESRGEGVRIGFVPFAGGVVRERVIGLTSLEDFQASLTKETFCSYVVQSASFGFDPGNPGGIQSSGVNSSTNYASALTEAEAMLAGEDGHKVVYFVSDGEPTSGGQDPAAAGVAAGQSLRANVQDLTLNGLLLGEDGAQALEVMKAVTGDESRVRVAAKASELATEIVKFKGLDLADATATLQRGDGAEETLSLAEFAKAAESSVWSFLTGEFELQAPIGQTVPHKITVAARLPGGEPIQVSAVLNVKQL